MSPRSPSVKVILQEDTAESSGLQTPYDMREVIDFRTESSMTVVWTHATSEQDTYTLRVSEMDHPDNVIEVDGLTQALYTLENLVAGSQYVLQVKVVNADGESELSDAYVVQFLTKPGRPYDL